MYTKLCNTKLMNFPSKVSKNPNLTSKFLFIDKVKRNESASSNDSRMTTDAVHRRFIHREESFSCIGCDKSFKITELRDHFVNISHKLRISCVYCGNAVHQYLIEDRKEVYHYCRYDWVWPPLTVVERGDRSLRRSVEFGSSRRFAARFGQRKSCLVEVSLNPFLSF